MKSNIETLHCLGLSHLYVRSHHTASKFSLYPITSPNLTLSKKDHITAHLYYVITNLYWDLQTQYSEMGSVFKSKY